jgi:hypothetical protein
VSGRGPGQSPAPEPIRPRVPRWRDRDWWFGRTPQQLARRERARDEFRLARADLKRVWGEPRGADPAVQSPPGRTFGGRIVEIGKVLTIVVTLPIVAAALFGPVGLMAAVVLAGLLLIGRVASDR